MPIVPLPGPLGPYGDFVLEINSVDVTEFLIVPSFRMRQMLCARGTLECMLQDDAMALSVIGGQKIRVLLDSVVLFAGLVETVSLKPIGTTIPAQARKIRIRASNWMRLAERYFVFQSYQDRNLNYIVQDIVDEQTYLSEDGITLGDVPDGLTLSTITFSEKRADRVFQELSELNGFCWYIDPLKKLHFYQGGSISAPFGISDASPNEYKNVTIESSLREYRNEQIVIGGVVETDTQTRYLKGDGTTTTWNLDYDVHEEPVITRNSVTQRLGIRGQDTDGDTSDPDFAQFFYSLGEKEISQNYADDEDLNPRVISGDELRVIYIGEYPSVVINRDDSLVDARKQIEGGSGVHQHVEKDPNMDGFDFALEKTKRLLELYGRVPVPATITTYKAGLATGQTIPIDLDDVGIDDDYLIDQITTTILTLNGPNAPLFVYEAIALDGPKLGGWQEFYRRQAEAGRIFPERSSQRHTFPRIFNEDITITDTLTDDYNDSPTLNPYTDDSYTKAFVGYHTQGSFEISKAIVGRSIIGVPVVP